MSKLVAFLVSILFLLQLKISVEINLLKKPFSIVLRENSGYFCPCTKRFLLQTLDLSTRNL